jgi:hypothetical protein
MHGASVARRRDVSVLPIQTAALERMNRNALGVKDPLL